MKTYLSLIFFLGLMPLTFGQGKLSIPPGGVVVLDRAVIDLDTLIMGHRARLKLTAPNTTLLIGHLSVVGHAIFDGQGSRGKAGRAGRNGRSDSPRSKATDGGPGGDGENGGNGINLKVYLNFERINGELHILLDGGNGGAAGAGGNGGSKKVICATTNRATDGGDSGVPGRGGKAGQVKIIFGSELGQDKIRISRNPGRPGSTAKGGKAGTFQRYNCGINTPRTRTIRGKAGESRPAIIITNMGSGGKIPEDHLAEESFPDRPPTPSARMLDLDLDLAPNPTLETVQNTLVNALLKLGYEENYNILRWRDGFALITNIELIQGSSGAPVAESMSRWSRSIKYDHTPSILGYLKSLIFPNEGFARVTVFLVGTPGSTLTTAQRATKEEAQRWFDTVGAALPADVLAKTFGPGMSVNAFIYEFSKKENSQEANLTPPTRLTARAHLTASGILPLITGQ